MYRTPSIGICVPLKLAIWGRNVWELSNKYSCDYVLWAFFGKYIRRILCHYFHGETEDGEETGFTISYFRNCRADIWYFFARNCTTRIVSQLTFLYKMLRLVIDPLGSVLWSCCLILLSQCLMWNCREVEHVSLDVNLENRLCFISNINRTCWQIQHECR
jgi:hypothetical protein